MKFQHSIYINGPKEAVWRVITDIEKSADTISAIEEIEILEPATSGVVGLKWRETRVMFGRSATEVMWITDAVQNDYYQTRAENHGAIYISRLQVTDKGDGTELTMSFEGQAQTLLAKIMSVIPGIFFKSATENTIKQDLEDIKAAVEKSPAFKG